MQDNQLLDALIQPLTGDHLIEASAGTGKTFTIAFLYVRLVLGHSGEPGQPPGRGLTPSEILVVTFTDAATKELRDRVRQRLTEAAACFAPEAEPAPEDAGSEDLLLRLRAGIDRQYWPTCQRRLLLAAESMDEAAISTIHSWCHRMLNEHAFDSGSLFRQTLKTSELELLDDVVRDYWRTCFYPLEGELMDEVLAFWAHPEALRQDLRGLLPEVESLPSLATDTDPSPAEQVCRILTDAGDQRRQQAEALRSRPWARWQPEVGDLLTELTRAKRLHGNTSRTMFKAWESLLTWAGGDSLLPENLGSTGFSNQTPGGLAEKLSGEGAVPSHPAFEAIEDLLAFAENPLSPRKNLLVHATRWVAGRLERQQQQRAEMGFNDLLTRLDQALQKPDQGPRLAERIRVQFPVALIDEFQDTDPVQYRIFRTVYQPGENRGDTGLLLIGDPKQAIYAFRGADIYTYLQAREAVAGRRYTLGTNFRSAEAMVQAVNHLFVTADQMRPQGAFLFREEQSNHLPFFEVAAHGRKEHWLVEGQTRAALTFWWHSGDKPVGVMESRNLLAEACASEIVRLLTLARTGQAGFGTPGGDLRPLRPGDIAILVNGATEAAAVRAALARRRVRSVYLSDRSSVLSSPVALDMLHWLRACAEPGQLALLRAALGTPLLALPFERLDQLLRDELVLEEQIETFAGYQALWQTRGVLPMLRRFLLDYRVPETLLCQADGERLLTDIFHLAEILQQASQQLDGEQALVHYLTELLRDAGEDDEHLHMRLESDADLVQVVTIHKSKGLEYPLVFLPFATAFREVDRKAPFFKTHDDQGRLQIWLEPDDEVLEQADRERLGEDVRKLYVALTRARYATWVGAAGTRNWERSGLGHLLGGTPGAQVDQAIGELVEAASGTAGALTGAPVPEPQEDHYQPLPESEPGQALLPVRAAREHWWIASYSAIAYRSWSPDETDSGFEAEAETPGQETLREEQATGEVLLPDLPVTAETSPGHHSFPSGPGPGTFLHDLLEWCASEGFSQVLADPEPLRQLLERRCLLRRWESWQGPLEEWLTGLIRLPLGLPGAAGPHSLAGLSQARPELEFWFESHQVDIEQLDSLVRQYIHPGEDRPDAAPAVFNGMLKGYIDLVFEAEGRYYLLDYKSNLLGPDDTHYTGETMTRKVLESRYDLQMVLYTLALHRLLKVRLPDYDYERDLGGAVYLFLRGYRAASRGLYCQRPPRALIEALDRLFAGEEARV